MTARPPRRGTQKMRDAKSDARQLTLAQKHIEPSRHQQLITGKLKVSELDDDEIENRRGRNSNGTFTNMANAYTPPGLVRSMANEADRRAIEKLRAAAPRLSQVIVDIAEDPDEDASDRLRAVDMALNRAWGKVPDKLVISAESTWDELDDVEVVRGDGEVIQGEVLDSRPE